MNRRTFLGTTGLSLAGAAASTAASGPRRLFNSFFANDEIAPAKHKPDTSSWSERECTVAWIGHSTLLLNFFGTKIITDPILSDRAGVNVLGLFTVGPKRIVAPALTREEIGKVDLILLSHAHMDHLDLPTLESLNRDARVVMAKKTSDIIEGLEYPHVQELDWNERATVCDVSIEAIEVKHFGWRYPWEHDRSKGYRDGRSFNAYVLKKNGTSFLFGGDTAYTPSFKKLGARGERIDVAAMPIGTYSPWIQNHCNPEQAHAMAKEMNAQVILPIHWSTFIQSDEPVGEPILRLEKKLSGDSMRLALREQGQTYRFG